MASFTVSNGKIIGPNGQPFIAKGINLFDTQIGSPSSVLNWFPGINMVRLAVSDLSSGTAASLQPFITQMNNAGIVVEIEDHSIGGGNNNVLTGSALSNELSWYSAMASAFKSNPYVWFGTMNEPNNIGDETLVSSQEQSIYNAIRGAGDNNPIMLEQIGGFTDSGLAASAYAQMHNVIWDTHFYGWVPNYSTDQTTVNNAAAAQVANAQSIQSADGVVPVIFGEYGPSSNGTSNDADWQQVLSAAQQTPSSGTLAWALGAGADTLVDNSGSLTPFGQEVASYIAKPAAGGGGSGGAGAGLPNPVTGTGSDTLALQISEDAYANGDGTSDANGDATFTVSVDGQQLGGTFAAQASHSAGQDQTFTFHGNWAPGSHTVAVNFLNDAWNGTSSSDRNLYVDGVTYDGTNTGQSAALMSAGPQNFAANDTTAISGGGSTGGSGGGSGGTTPPTTLPAPTTGTGSDTLTLTVSEDAYANADGTSDAAGDATFTVSVDGQQLGGMFTAQASHSAGKEQTFTFKGDWAPGSHTVAVNFLNDAWAGTSSADRNLYVDGVTYDAGSTGQSAAMMSAGPQTFSVTDRTAVPPAVTGSGSDKLTIKLSEDYYLGNGQFTVAVDGKQLGGTFTATTRHSSGGSQAFNFAGDFGAGQHTVAVTFLNDAYGGSPSLDRNLYVNDIVYNGTDTGASATLYANGSRSFTVSGGTVPTVNETGDHGSLQKNLSQTGTYTVGGDTFVLGSGNAVTTTLGTGTSHIAFIGPSSLKLTGGSGTATITADTGTDTFTAGSGSLDVTGGGGNDTYVFHTSSGKLSIEDFSVANGDKLVIDSALKAAMLQASDGEGGTLITFGSTVNHTIDVHGIAAIANTSITWA
jgi:hypothetical protein